MHIVVCSLHQNITAEPFRLRQTLAFLKLKTIHERTVRMIKTILSIMEPSFWFSVSLVSYRPVWVEHTLVRLTM